MLEDVLASRLSISLDGRKVLFAVGLTVEAIEISLKAGKKGFKVSDVRDGAVFAVLEQLHLAKNVSRGIIKRRCRDQDHPLATADLGQHFVGLGRFSSEAMRLIDEDIGILRYITFQ